MYCCQSIWVCLLLFRRFERYQSLCAQLFLESLFEIEVTYLVMRLMCCSSCILTFTALICKIISKGDTTYNIRRILSIVCGISILLYWRYHIADMLSPLQFRLHTNLWIATETETWMQSIFSYSNIFIRLADWNCLHLVFAYCHV